MTMINKKNTAAPASHTEVGVRINKYIAGSGLCSRRDADKLIEQGKVLLNGKLPGPGDKVYPEDEVQVNGKVVGPVKEKMVLTYYKPAGVVCTEKDEHAERTITTELKRLGITKRLTYAGRLDKDSEGLLLLTNDGDLIQNMMRGANGHEKEYVVTVDRPVTDAFLQKMAKGVYIEELDATTKPCLCEAYENKKTFRIILTQGLNRQIRRMCETLGYQVQFLKRIRVVNIELGNLTPGSYREITGEELQKLYDSTK